MSALILGLEDMCRAKRMSTEISGDCSQLHVTTKLRIEQESVYLQIYVEEDKSEYRRYEFRALAFEGELKTRLFNNMILADFNRRVHSDIRLTVGLDGSFYFELERFFYDLSRFSVTERELNEAMDVIICLEKFMQDNYSLLKSSIKKFAR